MTCRFLTKYGRVCLKIIYGMEKKKGNKETVKKYWILLGKILGLALLLDLVMELLSRKSLIGLLHYSVGHFPVFLANALLLLPPLLLILFTRRKVFLAGILVILGLTMGLINGVLLVFRTTPFTASDLRLIKYALSLLNTYLTWWQIVLAAAGLVVALAFGVLLWKLAPVDAESICLRKAFCAALAGLLLCWGGLHLAILTGILAIHFGNIGQAYQDYGFVYCFSNSLFHTGIARPDDYDRTAVKQVEREDLDTVELESGETYSLSEYQTPNIIMLQLESFFDPMLWRKNPVEKDPIPFFRYLMEHFPSGYLSVPSVGAGTANTEFECITGMNLDFFGPGEYPYKTVLQKTACESMAFDMKNLGYHTHAIHDNEATFYDRHKVFAQLGFDDFTPIEYMYDVERNPTGWCKDKILVGEIEKALDSSAGQDFIYTISVQGHGKYPSFEYYCQQIHEMDGFVKKLVRMLNARKEPTVLVMYGDHLPGFEWTADEMENQSLFQTNYVVWNNLNLPVQKRDVESYQLAAYVQDLLNLHEGTMFCFHQNYLRNQEPEDQKEDVAESAETGTDTEKQTEESIEEGTEESTEENGYLADMQLLEYDILYGDQEIYGGTSPYHTVKMEFGIDPIIQRSTYLGKHQVIVFGSGFNSYSRIFVNGKQVDTPYWTENRLIAPEVSLKGDDEITVRQVGRDKVPLGTARKVPGA